MSSLLRENLDREESNKQLFDDDDNDSDSSSHYDGDEVLNNDVDNMDDDVAADEKREIASLKALIVWITCGLGMGLSIVAAGVSGRTESQRFETVFHNEIAVTLWDHMGPQLQKSQLGTLTSLATSFTSHAKQQQRQSQQPEIPSSKSTTFYIISTDTTDTTTKTSSSTESWPFVTTPDFEWRRGQFTVEMTGASLAWMTPFVPEELRTDWEAYATQEQGWMIQQDPQEEGEGLNSTTSTTIATRIFGVSSGNGVSYPRGESNSLFFPIWQHSPPSSTLVNWDMATMDDMVASALQTVIMQQKQQGDDSAGRAAVLTGVLSNRGTTARLHQQEGLVPPTTDEQEPYSVLVVPMFDDFYHPTAPQPPNLVGVVAAAIPWKTFFQNVFDHTDTIGEIVVVVENSCGQTFSYMIQGKNAIYLGPTDQHQPYYDGYGETMSLQDILLRYTTTSATNSSSSPLLLLSTLYDCQFTVTVFPDWRYQTTHMTQNAAIYTGTVLVLVLFYSLLLLFYGGFLEEKFFNLRRKARHTTHVINKLFPKEVQDRMFRLDEDYKQQQGGGGAANNKNNSNTMAAGSGHAANAGAADDDPFLQIKAYIEQEKNTQNDSPPVADLYPDCTG